MLLPPTSPRPRMENGEGSLDLSHELTANLSGWGHQSRTFLQVLRYVQGKVCWAPAVAEDVPEMTVMGMKGDLQQPGFGASLHWEHRRRGNFERTKSKSFPPHSSQTPPDEMFAPFTTVRFGVWMYQRCPFAPSLLPKGQRWTMCPQMVPGLRRQDEEESSRQSSASR